MVSDVAGYLVMTSRMITGSAELSVMVKQVRSILTLLLVVMFFTNIFLSPLVLPRANLLAAEAPVGFVRLTILVFVSVIEHSSGSVKTTTIDLLNDKILR